MKYHYVLNHTQGSSKYKDWQKLLDDRAILSSVGDYSFEIIVYNENNSVNKILRTERNISEFSNQLITEEQDMNRVEKRIIKETQKLKEEAKSMFGSLMTTGMEIVDLEEEDHSYDDYMRNMYRKAEADKPEVKRENNTDIAEYRVFNVSMREMQIQTSDFEKAFEVWREGESTTGDRWTLLVMPPLNGKKLYLQDNAVHEYRIDKLMKDEAAYKDVGMAKPDFHGDFSEMDKWTQEQIINPKHYKIIPTEAYKNHPDGLEYMDIMEYALAHLSGVEAHTMGHVFKYSFRIGKKDAKLQDAKKIAWYANRMVEILESEE